MVAEVAQALNDVGFTVPAAAGSYRVGRAMGSVGYKDLDATAGKTAQATKAAAANAAHLAHLRRGAPYPK